jgi:hypothetical protein
MVLTTISAMVFLIVFLADLFGFHTNPYLGMLFFLVLPSFFVLGLILIPLGAWRERRRLAAGKAPSQMHWPRVDLNDPAQRRVAVMIFGLTMANIVVVSLAAYKGVEYMDSTQFCGQVCHTVMKAGVPGLPGRAAFARDLREVPHRSGRHLVRPLEGVRPPAGAGGGAQQLLAADRLAGEAAAAGPRRVRAVPLAGEIPRRQDRQGVGIRRRRTEHRDGDHAAGPRRRVAARSWALRPASTGT